MSKTIYEKAIEKYGEREQINMCIEEMAELTQALSKYKRHKAHNVEEEIADVEIMIKQMRTIFEIDTHLVDKWKEIKLNRLDIMVNGNGGVLHVKTVK